MTGEAPLRICQFVRTNSHPSPARMRNTVPFALSKQVLQDIPQSEFHALEGVAQCGFL
jgi:hypothetical protein